MKRHAMDVSGGCQCGAVRYTTTQMHDNSHLCHCRMCQKAVGNIFAALVAAPADKLVWTRGKPTVFMSSDHVERGFCSQCGTPLFYNDRTGTRVNLTIGSLDHPEWFPPGANTCTENQVPWFGSITSIEDTGSTETVGEKWAAAIKASNRQHPDHDTQTWPPAGQRWTSVRHDNG